MSTQSIATTVFSEKKGIVHSINRKLQKILVFPCCKSYKIDFSKQTAICPKCGTVYNKYIDTPILIPKDSPVLKWYNPTKDSDALQSSIKQKLKKIYRNLSPSVRVWTKKSQNAIKKILQEVNPDSSNSIVVLIGSGIEPVYKKILDSYKDIIRIGLSQIGDVNLFCDICDLPIFDDQLDLLLSSSVLEHVYNPELAVAEMYRVLKPGGYIYAEIPFMRAFHMIPIDYQRYTISGIEELFARHGFLIVEKGICSGPFTASVLYFQDFWKNVFSFNKYVSAILSYFLSLLLHPLKYLDKLFESSNWANVHACNFYYVGKKPSEGKI